MCQSNMILMYNTAGIILVISSVVLNTECVCGIRYLGYISVQGHMRQDESRVGSVDFDSIIWRLIGCIEHNASMVG